MVLQPVHLVLGVLHRDDRPLRRVRHRLEPLGQLDGLIAVRHPDQLRVLWLGPEQHRVLLRVDVHLAVLGGVGWLDVAAQEVHDHLHAVADPEDGDAVFLAVAEKVGGDAGRALDVDRVGAAREDDGLGLVLEDAVLGS